MIGSFLPPSEVGQLALISTEVLFGKTAARLTQSVDEIGTDQHALSLALQRLPPISTKPFSLDPIGISSMKWFRELIREILSN